MKLLILLGFLTLFLSGQHLEFGPEGDCGFAAMKPSRVSHFVDTASIAKATPRYPPALKAQGIGGKVYVRLLGNRAGQVECTCAEYVHAQPRPHRSLVIMAQAAALEWLFKPDFGLVTYGGSKKPKLQYIEGTIAFEFVP